MRKQMYGLISVLGFSFWFFLVFPFADHMESYVHVLSIRTSSLLYYTIHGFEGGSMYRPLAFACEWITYNISNSIAAPQVFNYLVAAISWLVVFSAVKERRTLSLLALVTGATFFSGYLFLFHISGVGYGPMLLFVALAVWFHQRGWDGNRFIWLSLIALVTTLFHPFASVVYLAVMAGLFLEDRKVFNTRRIILAVMVVILSAGSSWMLNKGSTASPLDYYIISLVTSYKTTEVKSILSMVSLAMALFTALSLESTTRRRIVFAAAVVVASVLVKIVALPVVIVWIAACTAKMILIRKYTIAGLVAATFILPFIGKTGTPTHAIYVILASTAATAIGTSRIEIKLWWVDNRLAFTLATLVILLVMVLRMGISVPIVSKLTKPIMAEKEKTVQMESIINWLLRSDYKDHFISFGEAAVSPRLNIESAINRDQRAPTTEEFLDSYLKWIRRSGGDPSKRLQVKFGDGTVPGARKLFTVEGRYAGCATVYLPLSRE